MINAANQRITLESYGQGASGDVSWMELVDRPLPDPFTPPGPLGGTLPPLVELDGNWNQNEAPPLYELDPSDGPFLWTDHECDCGSPPPPHFNVPPPPPPPLEWERGESEGEQGEQMDLGGKRSESKKAGVSRPRGGLLLPNCDGGPHSPQDACPALLIAGDAHVRPRLHPPIAALLVAATTFALLIAIAAVVCWRFRKHRHRPGSTKSTTDLTNGVLYDDLPSGPTPRSLTNLGHDTCTLAPMELLDLKRASTLQKGPSVPDRDCTPQGALPFLSHAATTRLGPKCHSGVSVGCYPTNQAPNSFHQTATAPFGLGGAQSPTKRAALRKEFSLGSRAAPFDSEFVFHKERGTFNAHDWGLLDTDKFQDFLRSTYTEPPDAPKLDPPVKVSQELYNPTYEEISTDSGESGTSSVNSSERGVAEAASRQGPGGWASTGYLCSGRSNQPHGVSEGTGGFAVPDYPEEPRTVLYGVMPPLPPPTLYTGESVGPGTSDGRTSTTSSSSDQHPIDRGAQGGPRYYVGGQRAPTPPCDIGGCSSPHQEGLPPLPSRSDRYRIFFTTDRKRSHGVGPPKGSLPPGTLDSKTLDFTARKRTRAKDPTTTADREPLYHEL